MAQAHVSTDEKNGEQDGAPVGKGGSVELVGSAVVAVTALLRFFSTGSFPIRQLRASSTNLSPVPRSAQCLDAGAILTCSTWWCRVLCRNHAISSIS